jgi:hypothetical protein
MMNTEIITGMNKILSAGYFCSMICVNFILFLISSFYRKKFNQPSPGKGFIIAIVLTSMYALCIFARFPAYIDNVKTVLLICGAIISGISSIRLFFIMKRTRK